MIVLFVNWICNSKLILIVLIVKTIRITHPCCVASKQSTNWAERIPVDRHVKENKLGSKYVIRSQDH